MNNKVIFVIAIIVAVLSGWFFSRQGKVEVPVTVETPKVESEATEIQAVQTNEAGETEYELNAKSLTQNPETQENVLNDVSMDWQPSEDTKYELTSGLADFNQETGDISMTQGFKLVSHQENEAESIIITGETLTGNTKLKQVKTDKPIRFKQGDNQFKANGMTANLATGEYEFDRIEIDFMPSERTDQALF